MNRLRRWLVRHADRELERMQRHELAHGPREQMHGITVVMFTADAERTRAMMDRVRAALDLVARYDMKSLTSMRAHFDHIQISSSVPVANAQYLHTQRLCTLSAEYLERESTEPARLAMTLVHELTHARHFSREKAVKLSLPQAEWLCIGAELAFIRKVPGTGHLERAARRRLERPPDFYGRRAQAERELEYIYEQKLPRWFMWILERLAGHKLPPHDPPPEERAVNGTRPEGAP